MSNPDGTPVDVLQVAGGAEIEIEVYLVKDWLSVYGGLKLMGGKTTVLRTIPTVAAVPVNTFLLDTELGLKTTF
jgi:hypothetical protein